MAKVMWRGIDLVTQTDQYLRGLLDKKPQTFSDYITLKSPEFEDSLNGSLSQLVVRVKDAVDILFAKYGESNLFLDVTNTGYYEESWSPIFYLTCQRTETEEEVKTRIELAKQAIAIKAEASAKRKAKAEAKKIEKLKATLANLTEVERAELLKG